MQPYKNLWRCVLLGSLQALEGVCAIEGLMFKPCLFDNNLPLLPGLNIFIYLLGLGWGGGGSTGIVGDVLFSLPDVTICIFSSWISFYSFLPQFSSLLGFISISSSGWAWEQLLGRLSGAFKQWAWPQSMEFPERRQASLVGCWDRLINNVEHWRWSCTSPCQEAFSSYGSHQFPSIS